MSMISREDAILANLKQEFESAEAEQGKLKNPCDSLLTEDSEDAKEQKSKLKGKSADICIIDEPSETHEIRTETHERVFSGDFISREDAVRAIFRQREFVNPQWYGGMSDAIDIIKALPSTDPPSTEPKQGEWIFNGYADEKKSWFVCSKCEHSQFHKSNFCPNCGARMKGGAE